MIYFTLFLIIFLVGIKPYAQYKKEYETKEYGFSRFDYGDYVAWLLEWFVVSLIFPISLAFMFIIYVLKNKP